MEKDFSTVPATQQIDEMSCWAASMQWWLSYMSPTRPFDTQEQLLHEFRKHTFLPDDYDTENYGGLSKEGLIQMLKTTRFKMKHKEMAGISLSSHYLGKKLAKSPVIVSFYDITGGGYHVNVIVRAVSDGRGNQSISAMEPRTGGFLTRTILHYQQGNVVLGYAK